VEPERVNVDGREPRLTGVLKWCVLLYVSRAMRYSSHVGSPPHAPKHCDRVPRMLAGFLPVFAVQRYVCR
jgi:hypothetical protein